MIRGLVGFVQSIASVARSVFAWPSGPRRPAAEGKPASRRGRRLFSIRYVMLLFFICAAFATTLRFSELRERDQLLEAFQDLELSDAQNAARLVEQQIRIIRAQINLLARDPDIINFNDNGKTILRDYFGLANKAWIIGVTRTSADMRLLFTYPGVIKSGTDLSYQPHNQRMAREHLALVSEPFRAVQGFNAIAVMEPVFDRNHQFVGSLNVLLDFEKMARDYVVPFATQAITDIFMFTDSGQLLILNKSLLNSREMLNVFEVGKEFPSFVAFARQMIAKDDKVERKNGKGHYLGAWSRGKQTEPTLKAAAFAQALLTPRTRWAVCVTGSERDILARTSMPNWPYIAIGILVAVLVLLAMLVRLLDESRYAKRLESEIEARLADLQHSEGSLKKTNRALKALSSCNKAMIHAREEQDLLDENCRILTAIGGYTLACVAFAEPGEPTTLHPAASNDATCPDLAPALEALRGAAPYLVNDIMDPHYPAAWRDDAHARGIRSLIALPLRSGDVPLGVLCVYSAEVQAFDPAEVDMLKELADDLSFGITTLRTRAIHRQAEKARMLLATAVEQAVEAIFITDIDGTIQYVNPAFSSLTGYPIEEAIGRNPRLLKSGQHEQTFYRAFWEALTHGQAWTGRFTNRRKDGSLFQVESMISPVRDEAGAIIHYVAVCRDITQELALGAQLIQAQKMDAVGQVAGGIAHDFNNILTGIIANISLAQLSPPGQVAAHHAEALQACERASQLVRQLLTFSRKSPATHKNITLNEVILEAATLAEKVFDRRVTFVIDPLPLPLPVQADPNQIHQVVMNLCVNARDAVLARLDQSPAGPPPPDALLRVTLKTYEATLNEGDCRKSVYARPGRFAVIEVADTGIGMSPEIQARIFDPFFTTKADGKGTGLGLATVYGIVKNHHGWIQVDSQPGQGTTFRIYLPLAEVPPASGDPRHAPEPSDADDALLDSRD